MTKKANSFHHLGHHMPLGPAGLEIRVYEDPRGYYASTIYNPNGRCPADIGPFDTSLQAVTAGFDRHGLEFEGRRPEVPFRRVFIETVPPLDMSSGW